MSRHILYNLFPLLKSLIKSGPNNKSSPNILSLLGTSIVLTYGHGAFALSTNKTEEICIIKKYTYVSNGFTNFMIVDDKGRHFNVNNSFWYWKWDSIEDWSNIQVFNKKENKNENNNNQKEEEKENKIIINYYGYRIPFLGMFPNVVSFPTNINLNNYRKGDILKHLHL